VDASDAAVVAEAWGPGAPWLLDRLPLALGDGDDPTGFDPAGLPPVLAEAWRSRLSRGWRVPASGRVMEALVAAVLEQKVTGRESRRAWRSLLLRHGERVPGPAPAAMRVFPTGETLRAVPSWEWHRCGVEGVRSATILRAAAVADRLEECADLPADRARARLLAVPGVGPWTAAEVAQRALGDADAVSFGDYHLARHTVFAFTGRTDGDDDGMRALLEPWRGHRYRVQRLVEVAGVETPRRGPRMAARDYRSF
jgi:3-methyladenine DNA glycosylase/8-oxoguanine DNA glycosylase